MGYIKRGFEGERYWWAIEVQTIINLYTFNEQVPNETIWIINIGTHMNGFDKSLREKEKRTSEMKKFMISPRYMVMTYLKIWSWNSVVKVNFKRLWRGV